MASSLLPPNPCLVAILLIVNYHHQPRIVFHYPPRPGEDNAQFKNYLSSDCSDGEATTSSDDESGGSSDSNAGTKGNRDDKNKDEEREMEIDVDEAGSVSPEKFDGVTSMRRSLQWDDVFGYQAMNLAKLLCPALSNHKKRFEMSLNEKAFLGWPVFSKDGRWQRKKKGEKWKSGNHSLGGSKDKGERRMIDGKTSLQISEELGETSGQDTDLEGLMKQDEVEEGITPGFTTSVKDVAPKGEKVAEEQAKPKRIKDEVSMDTLKMFHVVFVLDPPPLEYHFRMKEMYDHVVKKFSRALKWEQARSNYVTREVANISSTCKTSRKSGDHSLASMYHQITSQSSLAKGISTLFNHISNSKIAHIKLTPTLSLSLQIPIATSTSVLPNLTAPQIPGLWLTTATSLPTEDDINTTSSQLASHFTLLLLCDLSTIISDISATASPLTSPLVQYLRVSKPTKSFLQISQASGIALSDIQFLASHLIYWRRARAIPPLHQRDTYIVSPNADMRKLASATVAFGKAFPPLSPLPKILNLLSFTPRVFSTIIPSKEHKEIYIDILAWLLRNGWVTQLRSFVWVRVPTYIKEIVSRQPPEKEPTSGPPITDPNRSPSPASSSHSNSTAFPFTPQSPSLIPHPTQASGLPSRHLAAISSHIREQQGKETQAAWDKCVRYFDGRHAVETIAVREGWKKRAVEEWVAGWEELGVLVRRRHW